MKERHDLGTSINKENGNIDEERSIKCGEIGFVDLDLFVDKGDEKHGSF